MNTNVDKSDIIMFVDNFRDIVYLCMSVNSNAS
jgi:hypothetical protein